LHCPLAPGMLKFARVAAHLGARAFVTLMAQSRKIGLPHTSESQEEADPYLVRKASLASANAFS